VPFGLQRLAIRFVCSELWLSGNRYMLNTTVNYFYSIYEILCQVLFILLKLDKKGISIINWNFTVILIHNMVKILLTRRRNMKKSVAIIALLLIAIASIAMAGTLEDVQKKGVLTCGISEGVPGFSIPDSKGHWKGFDVDMARAVAAAVLSDPEKVKFVPLASKQKIIAVSSKLQGSIRQPKLTAPPYA